MKKRILSLALVALAGLGAAAADANAGIYFGRVAPVRRVAARAVLPPYPVARRVVAVPYYRPYVAPVYRPAFYAPAVYGAPYYGPGVSISVGF